MVCDGYSVYPRGLKMGEKVTFQSTKDQSSDSSAGYICFFFTWLFGKRGKG